MKLIDLEALKYFYANLIYIFSTKVDKVDGKDLISTSEINRLKNVENYDDTSILSELDDKVDKVTGKGLSTNDFTDDLKTAYDSAVTNSHTHSNKSVLDDTTASFTIDLKNKLDGVDTSKYADSLDLSIDTSTYVMSISLKNGNTAISTKTIDFPIESMVIGATYNPLSKKLELTLQNGNKTECDISDIVSGLVPDTRKIAGFDLKDDITVAELQSVIGGGSGDISLPDDENAMVGDMIYVKEVDENSKPIAWSYSKPSSIEVYDTQSRTEFKSYTGTLNGYNFLNSENKVEHKAYRIDSSTILIDDVSHALNINDYILITSTENSNYCMIKRIDNENIVARFFVDKEMVLEKNLLVFKKKPVTIYGFHINSNESNPSNAVTYLEDAVGMTPAYMNYTTGQFDYGSWEDAFFMPRPCMLKSDGTVDYYLDPNDYSKKADGTASDIANTSYDGNAMMEWGKDGKKIWLKVVPDTNDNTSASIYIADEQDDDEYTCYNFVGSDGVTVKDHFYTPIYQGSLVSSKLRSLSGRTVIQSNTANNEVTYATANGTGWYTECWCDMELLQDLLVLISKSLDTQTSFGNGGCNRGSSASYMLATGTMNTKGLFWGSSSTSEGVKVFGMENLWGNQYRRFAGFVSVNGTAKIKKCFGTSDGSTTATYNFDGTGYKSCGTLTNGSGYLSKINFSSKNNIPIAYNGSSSTYYCDYAYVNTSGTYYACLGGACHNGLNCGAFFLDLDYAASYSGWYLGASLSFR